MVRERTQQTMDSVGLGCGGAEGLPGSPRAMGASFARAPWPIALLMVAACAWVGAACSSASGAPSGSGGGPGAGSSAGSGSSQLGAACSVSAPCGGGLMCAESGSLYGRCTLDCSTDSSRCEMFGLGAAICLDETSCAPACTTAADCISNSVCTELTSGNSVCIPNPNGPPGASLPNGACENLGGATGDTVVNGGYRCTLTNNASLGTSIDLCQDGEWVHGGDCTCLATSSITGEQVATDCEDFQAPGTAECIDGVDTCLICSPGTGCLSE